VRARTQMVGTKRAILNISTERKDTWINLPDMTDLFDSPPASQSLRLYRKPESMENIGEGAINENDGDGDWDSTPPSILSSSLPSRKEKAMRSPVATRSTIRRPKSSLEHSSHTHYSGGNRGDLSRSLQVYTTRWRRLGHDGGVFLY